MQLYDAPAGRNSSRRLALPRGARRIRLAFLVGHLADDQRPILDLRLDVFQLLFASLLLSLPLGAHEPPPLLQTGPYRSLRRRSTLRERGRRWSASYRTPT